ncbi:MAG: hypothetical protein R3E58_03050 [Phycisphaerae bacterium]
MHGCNVDGIVKGLMGAVHDWAQDPIDTINYFEAARQPHRVGQIAADVCLMRRMKIEVE